MILFFSLLKAIWRPIIVNFDVIWSLVGSCLIGNYTIPSYFYKILTTGYCKGNMETFLKYTNEIQESHPLALL